MTTTARATGQQRRSLRTREHIIDAALRVFGHQGYPESSMEDVCREAGCSKGGLYHHYPTKEALLLGVLGHLQRLGGLKPPLGGLSAATGLPEAALGRLTLDIWALSARTTAVQGSVPSLDDGLLGVLLCGQLVQALTLGPGAEPAAATRRLGIRPAA
jgi:hypothetical protein